MSNAPSFGGAWTSQKLDILRRYLNAYTTALKNQGFSLTYVDGFAGAGVYTESSQDYQEFQELHDGSARIALRIDDRQFDRLLFIEKDGQRARALRKLAEEFPDRVIDVVQGDANEEVQKFCQQMRNSDRAVVFLDPYATEVSWETIAAIAKTKKIDCLIWFPLMAVARMMPLDEEPSPDSALHLERILGGREYWRQLYHNSPQLLLFGGEPLRERPSGHEHISDVYRNRLKSVFHRVAQTRRTFKNSKNSEMFELFVAAGNPRGAPIAVNIANHVLKY